MLTTQQSDLPHREPVYDSVPESQGNSVRSQPNTRTAGFYEKEVCPGEPSAGSPGQRADLSQYMWLPSFLIPLP